jgi:hypothetical protein
MFRLTLILALCVALDWLSPAAARAQSVLSSCKS